MVDLSKVQMISITVKVKEIRVSYVKLSGQLNKDFRVKFFIFLQSTKSGHQLEWGEHITATHLPIEIDGVAVIHN